MALWESENIPPSSWESGNLKLYCYAGGWPDEEPEVVLIKADKTGMPESRSEWDWAMEFLQAVGFFEGVLDEIIPRPEQMDKKGWFIITGRIYGEKFSSPDYGEEYDEGFDIIDIRPMTKWERIWVWAIEKKNRILDVTLNTWRKENALR